MSSLRRRKALLSIYSWSNGYATESKRRGLTSVPPIEVGFTESAGRGVFATRRIGAGELIHTDKPILSHPSLSSLHSVCYFCLKNVASNLPFCSDECRLQSKVYVWTPFLWYVILDIGIRNKDKLLWILRDFEPIKWNGNRVPYCPQINS